jgi:hypothetical membrane protein
LLIILKYKMQNKNIILLNLALSATVISLAALLYLHFVSPEFSPSWRMISEYAKGKYEWLLTVFFLSGGLSVWCAAFSIWSLMQDTWGKIGVVLLFISGIGGLMASIFNISHPLHGTAALIGVPTFPLASILISFNLCKRYPFNHRRLMWAANFTWISIVLMVITMIAMISGLKKAGVFHPGTNDAPKTIPIGVIALVGYANRLLILANSYWLILVSLESIKLLKRKNKNDELLYQNYQGFAEQKITGNKTF